MKNKIFYVLFVVLFFAGNLWAQTGHDANQMTQSDTMAGMENMSKMSGKPQEAKGEIEYYTCGMHPSVRVDVKNYDAGKTQCPICSMNLIPVMKKNGKDQIFDKGVISRVKIKARELKLAGVETQPVKKRKLFKEVRAVGRIAYDPDLAIAQDEFISSLKSYEKAKQGVNAEIIERAKSLVESSRRKLQLLGLSESQINDLARQRQVQMNLILPEDKMWVYGEVYEYELPWIKEGVEARVRPIGLDDQEFIGHVVSINPIIDPRTRSVKFRALIDSPGKELKPEMYADILIRSQYVSPSGEEEVLSIPRSSLLDTGRRKIVWVDKSDGDFEGRDVKVGQVATADSGTAQRYYPVLGGLKEGEQVVVKGNFLVDSQSQITGVASSAYGGAIGKEKKGPMQMNGSMSGHLH